VPGLFICTPDDVLRMLDALLAGRADGAA